MKRFGRYARFIYFIANVITVLLFAAGRCPEAGATPQETVNFASASGRVTDSTGAVISGASIVARQIDTNQANTATADPEGRFRFPYLKPGRYEIAVHQPGFADALR